MENEKFLVVTRYDDGTESVSTQTEYKIIDRVDMQDCSNTEIEVYRVKFGEEPEKLTILGTWHMFDDPLYIAVVNKNGNVVFDGYGTDH